MTLGPILYPEILSCERENNIVQLTLHIPISLAYFEGHFKNAPLVAGVVQIHWAVLYGQEYFDLNKGTNLDVTQASHLKFSHPIFPKARIFLTLNHHLEKKVITFKYTSKDETETNITHSSGRFHYV